jgi:phosphoribosylamine--glycine ligase
MMLLKSDFAPILFSSINGTLNTQSVRFRSGAAACVVLAAGGYPGKYEKGQEIHIFQRPKDNVEVFHAGTVFKDGHLVTNGGRVLGVTATGRTLTEAIHAAYSEIDNMFFIGMQFRHDIGYQGLGEHG